MVWNVIVSWTGQFVFIVAGFIMPRMIDRHLGQDLLGVWDFAWSLVNYFSLVQAGIGSSVNRYVAKYRGRGDIIGVNRVVSSAFCIMLGSGTVVLALTAVISHLLPQLFAGRLAGNVDEAQGVVFFLGMSLSIEVIFGVFHGVVTGCHRWELHNLVKSGWYGATVVAMIAALTMGGGLRSLALMTCLGTFLTEGTSMVLAHRVCKGLRLRPSSVRLETVAGLLAFGGKSLLPSVSNLLLNQTTCILIMAYLNPAALALYARPRSLMYNVNTLVSKMALVLTPTISSLQSTGDFEAIRELLIRSVRYSLYMALPIVLALVIFGDAVMLLWMGPRYADGLVPAILAIGSLAAVAQLPVLNILTGLNAHGRAGLAQLIASLSSVGLTIIVLSCLKWGLAGAAVAVTLPLTMINTLYMPLVACRRVDLGLGRYLRSVMVGPVAYVSPFAACLVVARVIFHDQLLAGLAWGGSVGSLVLAVLYWHYVLPESIREKIARIWRRSRGIAAQHDQCEGSRGFERT
jgi:O-antigen/teichoic acid export membrane protein